MGYVPMGKTGCSTPERILTAAYELFAERGFDGATTQEICSRANANIAAVNYHYGSKENLYRAVWEHGNERALRLWEERAQEDAPVEEKLRQFIELRVTAALSEGEDSFFSRLIHREFSNPSPLHKELHERFLRPKRQWFMELIREIVGEDVSDQVARLAGFCIHSPLIHLIEMQSHRKSPPHSGSGRGPARDPKALADTLYMFALAGLKELRSRHGEIAQ
ncbi:MAG: CerR family C-terminal domain-containing protein [Victivallales bacterium]|jgi:TetR/AcrR family transcriptional regulator, regulator of cefoperazone and chloramphenicol sensitivity|nr:CerR family C-terminal domain-containing protein [Victivallales bacterium]